MEELSIFFRLLKKHKYTLLIIPILTIIITFFLVRNLPDSYVSQAQLSTGIVDETQQTTYLSGSDAPKATQVNQEFSNLVEMMKMKKMLDQVSYLLIIHDLTSPEPFREKSKFVKDLKSYHIAKALAVFREKYKNTEGLNLWDNDQKGLYNMLRSMKYNSDAIKDKLRIYRSGDSDFINIEFDSENPELSAFVVNSLSEEFIKYYTYLVKTNQRKATTFLGRLLQEKRDAMNDKVAALRDYKIKNRVLNLEEQSSQLYAQILNYTDRKQQTLEGIASKAGALNEIDRKFNPNERSYLESTLTKVNQNIMSTKEQLRSLHDLYIESGYETRYKNSIDSLQNILANQINRYTDQYIYNPLAAKQEIVQQKLTLDIQLDMLRYSMNLLEKQLNNLNGEFDKLVPHEAEVQSMEREVDVTSREYLDILHKFNQSNMEYGLSIKLNMVQKAMPGLAQASKKMLLVILSGIISFVFCVAVIFILFLIDNTIRTPKALANKTNSAVLGSMHILKNGVLDLKKIWSTKELSPDQAEFKSQVRSIRFEIDKELKDKVLLITSINKYEGKTLLALNLAFAWKLTNKKVLLIDGNFSHPDISNHIKPDIFIEDFFLGTASVKSTQDSASFTVMGNRGGDKSPLEIITEDNINNKLAELKDLFDVIIIETVPLIKLNQATEWMLFSKNIVAVFEAGQTLAENKKQYVNYLNGLGAKFNGWVLNKQTSEYS